MNLLSVLIIKVYRIVYFVTGLKVPSFIIALLYITVLHMIMIFGVALLLQDMLPTSIIINYFSPPYLYGIGAAIFAFNYFVTPPLSTIITDMNRASNYTLLIVYSAIAVILLGYELLTK